MQYLSNSRRELSNSRYHNYMCDLWDIWSKSWGDMTWLKKDLPAYRVSFSENLKIFRKSQIFPKISTFSKNFKNFRKSQNFPKISKFSENLKIFRKSQNIPKILIISEILKSLQLSLSSRGWSQPFLANTLKWEWLYWCDRGLWR